MAITSMLLGFSGEGLSYSMKNLDPNLVGLFSPTAKPLPFKAGKNIRRKVITDLKDLGEGLRKSKAPIIIIDDFDYFISLKQLQMAKMNLKGDALFSYLRTLAYEAWCVIDTAVNQLDPLRRVYILAHADEENGRIKMKSTGKMFDNMLAPEGLCSPVLQTKVDDSGYSFMTQNNGHNPVKSPEGMFDKFLIPNDLNLVDDAICAYYGIPKNAIAVEAIKDVQKENVF